MSYPNYLIHFNKNHSSSTGQFISGDGDGDGIVNDHKNQHNGPQMSARDRQRANKKLYKTVQKIRDKNYSNNYAAEKYASKNAALKDAAKDEKLQEAYKTLKSVKSNPDLKEPSYWDDEYTMTEATKMFKKDWPDWDGDPADNKYFGYYVDDVAQTSKTYAKALQDYEKAKKADSWNKAYDQYEKELQRVAEDFAGDLADKPFQGNEYFPYSSVIRFALGNIMQEE